MTFDVKRITARLGRLLPAYQVGGELGRGGFGTVFAGHHRTLDRPVAIKVLSPSYAAMPAVRACFVNEARVLARLDHANVVRVYDYVEQGDICALVMEHLGGGTLAGVGSDLAPGDVCAIGVSLCAALGHAHGHGIVHRDVKPGNIMFSTDGVLKLTDFGLAGETGSRAGAGLEGTPEYMAPEQPFGDEVGPSADVYAAGLVLYELLAASLPFPVGGDPLRVVSLRLLREPRPLVDLAPHVPAAIAATVMRALVRDPAARFRSATAFGTALARAAAEELGPGWREACGPLPPPAHHGGPGARSLALPPTLLARPSVRRAA